MPINPLIAMHDTSGPDAGTQAFDTFNTNRNAAQVAAMNQEKIAQAGQETQLGAQKVQFSNALINAAGIGGQLNPQAAPQPQQQPEVNPEENAKAIKENYKQLSEREKTRLNSVLDAGAAITPLVQANDQQGTINALMERKKELGGRIAKGEHINTEDTDAALQQAATDWGGFQQTHAALIHVGQMLGHYKTQKEMNAGDKPALLQTLEAYKNASPEDQAILRTFAKVDEKGTTIDPASKKIVVMPGAAEATASLAGAKAGATENAKLEQQLQYEPTIEGNKVRAKSDAEFKTKARQNLPQALDNADYLNQQLDGLLSSPGKKQAIGGSSVLPIVPGTDAADFVARLEQIKGEQFLQAFQSLKGGGQITEIEGQKATDAIARMQRSQSEPEFDKSVNEFKGIVAIATKRAKAAADLNGESNKQAPAETPAEKAAALLPPEEKIPTGGNINTLPQGAKQIGTSGGKPVYQTPDGKKFLQD